MPGLLAQCPRSECRNSKTSLVQKDGVRESWRCNQCGKDFQGERLRDGRFQPLTNLLKPLRQRREESDRLRRAIRESRSHGPQKQEAHKVLLNEEKRNREVEILRRFASVAASLNIKCSSIESRSPPEPDIWCLSGSDPYYFELARITEGKMAITEKNPPGHPRGGPYSNKRALLTIIRKKAEKTYLTNGIGVDLVLYYYEQPAPPISELARMLVVDKATVDTAILTGPFQRIWIFDIWSKCILYESGKE